MIVVSSHVPCSHCCYDPEQQAWRHGSSHHIWNVFSLEGISDTWSGKPGTLWKLKRNKYNKIWVTSCPKKYSYMKVKQLIRLRYLNIPLVMLCGCTSSDDPGLSQSSQVHCGLQILVSTTAYFSGSSHGGAHEDISDSGCSLDTRVCW